MEVRFLRAMCEIAISCLQKCPQASVFESAKKKTQSIFETPYTSWIRKLGLQWCLPLELQMDSWMLLLDSAKVWDVGAEEKEEAGGWRKIREAGEPRKNSVGEEKEEAGGKERRKEHLKQCLK